MSELRQDLVSGDWIVNAPGRALRPHEWKSGKSKRVINSIGECPFENLEKSGNWPPLTAYPNDRNWRIIMLPNKYPVMSHTGACAQIFKKGPFAVMGGVGSHDLVITRDHRKYFADLSAKEARKVLELFQKQYKNLRKDACLFYTLTFFNWGPSAGASLSHPHYQILTLPIIPPDVQHSLRGSAEYYKKHRKCVHCEMLAYEKKSRVRIIEKNQHAIAVAPFVSRMPHEVRIFPRTHHPYYEETSLAELSGFSDLLQSVLRRIKRNLGDPDLNFFIHTAPLKNQDSYRYYHWHLEIIPHTSIPAGFELGTGIEINAGDPDVTARLLRGGK